MDKKEITKEYTNGDLTVVWKPGKCIHSAICVKTLPEVYDPNSKPWIKPENTSTDELKSQIDKCPSGALSYYIKGKENEDINKEDLKVDVMVNGPLLVHGNIIVTNTEDQSTKKDGTTAFCRCGYSTNKPYCDGSHKKEGFIG